MASPTKKVPKLARISTDKGSLRLTYTWASKVKYIYLGLSDTTENREAAQAYLDLLCSDLRLSKFDPAKTDLYKPQKSSLKGSKNSLEGVKESKPITLLELWEQYTGSKESNSKAKTVDSYKRLGSVLAKCNLANYGAQKIRGLDLKASLLEVTTFDMTRRILLHLQAAYRWANRYQLLDNTTIEGLHAYLPKPNYQKNPQAHPFTKKERDSIIQDFAEHPRYKVYKDFVLFLFHSGCRPSEAIGLQWASVSRDYRRVSFVRSITKVGGEFVVNEGSKNNKKRTLPCGLVLSKMLKDLYEQDQPLDSDLVFNFDGQPIDYDYFARNVWKRVTKEYKEKSTPYDCRDTFISLQSLGGVSDAQIGEWCDTSPQMIQQRYRSLEGVGSVIVPVD